MKKGTLLTHKNRSYIQSESSISLNLEYQPSNLRGTIWISSPTQLTLWVPNTPKQTLLNGQDLTASYSSSTQILSLTIPENGSLFISYNPVKSRSPSSSINIGKPNPPQLKTGSMKSYGTHPFLYFNESTLPILRNRVLNSHPWQDWFTRAEARANNQLTADFSSFDGARRSETALNLAFTGVIKQNITFINKAKDILRALDEVVDYDLHLSHSRSCGIYAITYDMIYQNLSAAERLEIAGKLENHTLPLIDKIPILPRNNHIGVVASGIGLTGLALDKTDWVNIGISGVDDYFSTSFAEDGGNFEGYSYAGYFLESGLKFFYALQNLGEKNYFSDAKFLSFINNTILSQTPLTTIPLFEDSDVNPQIVEDLLWASSSIYPYAPSLSNYSQWVFDRRSSNDGLVYDGNYLDSSYNWTSGLVNRICLYTFNITPCQPPLQTIVTYYDAGISIFRNGWGQDALYLSITCKNKADFQYHAHYDETSFEIWAYGAWLATNPGYPGFGYGEYDQIIQTEASNTILLKNQGQQRLNADGFREYFSSSEVDGVTASASSLYSSPGSISNNLYFLGLIIFIFSTLVIASIIIFHLRRQAFKSNVFIIPKEQKTSFSSLKTRNLSLKIHLGLIFGLSIGILISLIPFLLSTNIYVQEYTVGKHGHIANIIPLIEIALITLTPILVILIFSLKFKFQNSLLRRITVFSTNLKESQIPPLKDFVKLSYLPQTFFLLIFIPVVYLFYLPLIEEVVNFIFTQAGSVLDIQNHIINTLGQYIVLFTLTLLLYLPFKVLGLYLSGQSLSDKVKQPTSDGVLMSTASYLLSLTLTVLLVFFVTLILFYGLDFLGVSFLV
jgi:hypothetical protein